VLTVDLILYDRLAAEEEERKRQEREAATRAEGAMGNLLTLLSPAGIQDTMRQVRDEVGLLTLEKGYNDIVAAGVPMSADTYREFIYEYGDPGHLAKTFQTAVDQGIIKDDPFGQQTASRFDGLTTTAAHFRERGNLSREDYWRMISESERGIDRGALLDEIAVLDPAPPTSWGERFLAGDPSTFFQTPIPESALEKVRGIPVVGAPIARTAEIATTPIVGLTLPLGGLSGAALKVAGESILGAGIAGGVAEELGLPPEAQMGAEVVGGFSPLLRRAPGVIGRQLGKGAATEAVAEVKPVIGAKPLTPEVAAPVAETAPVLGREGAVPAVAEKAAIPEAPPGQPRLDPPVRTAAQPSVATEFELPPMGGGRGTSYAGELRPFADVVAEVETSDNPVVQALVARTGINPSVAQGTPLGRTLVAYERQMVAADQLTEVALQAGLDSKAQRYVGRQPFLQIDKAENLKGVTPKPGVKSTSLHWLDVFSRPGDYVMDPALRAYIDDYLRIVDDAEALRVLNGLKPLATRTPEDGWFYVPRKVVEAHGITPKRPSDPHMMRVYEEAAEGHATGTNYGRDPRENLRIHVRQSYREIIEAQLSEAVEPLSVTTKEIMPKPVLQRMSDATVRRIAAERAVRRELAQRGVATDWLTPGTRVKAADRENLGTIVGYNREANRASVSFYNKQTGARATVDLDAGLLSPLRSEEISQSALEMATPELRVEMEAAKAEWTKARSAYTASRKAAEKAQWTKGALFGRQEEYIPIVKWRNRFLPREDYEKLTDALRFISGGGPKANVVGRAHQVLGNAIRFLASVGDFAEPFVQGLLVFGKDPVVWSRATLRHYQAFFDPTVQARMIKDHLGTFQEMARYGTPVGDPEFFAAMRTGEGIPAGALLSKVPGGAGARQFLRQAGRQSFGRFQSQYNTGLGYSRALLTEAMKPTWKGTASDLQASIRNLTGGLDTRALGVGPTQRGIESMWLAFAPRLLRSTTALVGDLRYGVMNPRGRVAWESLGKLGTAATGLYITTGLALGKSWDEILAGLNPLAGKKFMSHEVNGDWIGVGGQVRAIAQLLATTGADIYKVRKGERPELTQMSMDNPLFQFYSSRGAVGMTTAGAAVEAATGLNTMPFENIDSPPDLLKHIGTSALPFTIQGQLEGESLWTWPASFLGARVSAGTTWEDTQRARDAEAKARGFKGWDDPNLDEPTKYQIDQTPKVAGLLTKLEQEGEDRPQTPQSQYYDQVDKVRAGQLTAQQTDDDLYNAGKITAREWDDRTTARNRDVWAAMQQAQKDFGITFEDAETTNPVDAAIAAYYAVDAEQYKDETGAVRWDEFMSAREAALAPLSTSERSMVEDYVHKLWTPTQWEMFRKGQQLQEYFNIPDTVYAANKDRLGLTAPSYSAYRAQATQEAQASAAAKGLGPEYVSERDYPRGYTRLQDMITREKDRYRRQNPDKNKLIIELGYKTASKADIARARGRTTGVQGLTPLTLPEGGGLGNLPPLTLPTP